LGSYEFDKQQLFTELITPGSTVFDIGANAGYYTLLSSSLVGQTGRIFAFEPLPRNLRYLRKHLLINNCTNVEVLDVAVSDREGFANFDDTAPPAMGSISERGSLTVRTVTLDDLLAAKTVGPPRFMKIDVEGGEVQVLQGAAKILRDFRPVIFLATHGPQIHKDCMELLTQSGYRLTSVDERPVEQSDELLATPTP
jgi:FkbM family methyltransferase